MLLLMDALLKKKIESCRRDIGKTYNQECNRREVKCEVGGCDLWEQKSIWEFKMDMMGEISLTRLRGKRGEVELCSAAIHYSLLLPIFPYFSWFSLVSIWRRRLRFFWFSFCPSLEGWKMRLALACAVAQGADVFLLDEPTNHLDSVASQRVKMSRVWNGVLFIPKWADQTWSFQEFGWLSHWLLGIFSLLAIDSHGDYPCRVPSLHLRLWSGCRTIW